MLKVFPITKENTLICTVGLPYSGKTTEALRIASYLPAAIVCPDAIRVALHGQRFVGAAERMVWTIAHQMVDALFLAGHKFVVLDATCNTRRRRDDWRNFKGYSTWFFVVDPLPSRCAERAHAAGDDEIIKVIDRMAQEHEPLGDDEIEYTHGALDGAKAYALPAWMETP